MAKVHNGSQHLQQAISTYKQEKRKGTLQIILSLVVAFLLLFLQPLVGIVVGIVLVIYFSQRSSSRAGISAEEYRIQLHGLNGEKRLTNQLAKLPENYDIYTNVFIEWQGKQSELDSVVVGPTGIYVVEMKSMRGRVYGDEAEKNWYLEKTGRQGGVYGKEFYNPTKQVGTHVYRLANNLRPIAKNLWVQGVVLFDHETALDVTSQKTIVTNDVNQLRAYIEKQPLTVESKDIARIKSYFEQGTA